MTDDEWKAEQPKGTGDGPLLVDWDKYPIRKCRTLHMCSICKSDIADGQSYHDGGCLRRAHVACVLRHRGRR